MTRITRRACMGAIAGTAAALSGVSSFAQAYPTKTIFIKVAYPAGGPADAITRAGQAALQASLGQTVVVENIPGASGSIAAMRVRSLPADGYSILVTTTDLILAPKSTAAAKYQPSEFKSLGFNLITDMVLVASPAHNFKSVDDFIERTRKQPASSLSIGHWGHGSTTHLMGADFQSKAGIKLLEVPYAGVAPIIPALLGNQVDLSFMPFGGPVMNLVQTGKLKAIGVASKSRHPSLPDAPTLSESRYLKDIEYAVWSGLFVLASTPLPVQETFNESLRAWLDTPESQAISKDFGIRKFKPMTLAEADRYYKAEQLKLDQMAKALQLSPQ